MNEKAHTARLAAQALWLAFSGWVLFAGELTEPGRVDPTFSARLSHRGYVEALAQQPDGRFYVAGFFEQISGVAYGGLARLWPDGEVDMSFVPPPSLNVNAVTLQPDGRVLANLGFSGVPSRVVRLNPDGGLDAGFTPYSNHATTLITVQPDGGVLIALGHLGGELIRLGPDGGVDPSFEVSADGPIKAVTVLPSGQLLVGGWFSTVNGVARGGIARLNREGTVDAGFRPAANPDAWVNCLAVLPDGRTVIAGGFGWSDRLPRRAIARLHADGGLDATFDPGEGIGPGDVEIKAVAVQADGRVLIGGNFARVNGAPRAGLARLNADGSLDTSFIDTGLGHDDDIEIRAILIQSADKALVGGDDPIGLLRVDLGLMVAPPAITQQPESQGRYVGQTASFAVEATGTPPLSYKWLCNGVPVPGATNASITLSNTQLSQAGTYKVIVSNSAGTVTSAPASLTVQPVPTGPGSLDITFDPTQGDQLVGLTGERGPIQALARQPDGKVIIAGDFVAVDGVPRQLIARLNPDGTLDPSFAPGAVPNGPVACVELQDDGALLIAGEFTRIGGRPRVGLARLHADGSLDASFHPPMPADLRPQWTVGVVLRPDGRVVYAATFHQPSTVSQTNVLLQFLPDGTPDAGFHAGDLLAGFNTRVDRLVVQSDGKVILSGAFGTNGGLGLARMNGDGSLDPTFNLRLPEQQDSRGVVWAMALQPDGRIVADVSYLATDNRRRYGLFRLNSDGSVDPTFSAEAGHTDVRRIAVQADGRIVLAGDFEEVNGVPRVGLARLNPNGTLDTAFDPGDVLGTDYLNRHVNTILALPDGRLWVSSGRDCTSPGPRLFRLNAAGGLDPSFTPLVERAGDAFRFATLTDGRVLACGSFQKVNNLPRAGIARLQADGTLDASFNAGLNPGAQVNYFARQTDGRIIISGWFTNVHGVPRHGLARLNPDGSLDASFEAPVEAGGVRYQFGGRVALFPDGKVITLASATVAGEGSFWQGLVRLNTDGSLDRRYDPSPVTPGTDFYLRTFAVLPDGKVLLGGELYAPGIGASSIGLIRFNPDGTLDPSFVAACGYDVLTIAVQPDGRILIGGSIPCLGDWYGLARLNPDGSLDSSFILREQEVSEVVLQRDGSILVASGENGLIRLLPDGTLDASLQVDAPWVYSVSVQADGRLFIAGAFTAVNGYPMRGFARLNGSPSNGPGAVDFTFTPGSGLEGWRLAADCLVPQADGKILIGGGFTNYAGAPRAGLARVNPDGSLDAGFAPRLEMQREGYDFAGIGAIAVQPDGMVLVGGWFTSINGIGRTNFARLYPDGRVDEGFAPQLGAFASAYAIVVQPDGRILIGGNFEWVNDTPRPYLARLNADGSLDPTFTPPRLEIGDDWYITALGVQRSGQVLVAGHIFDIPWETYLGVVRLHPDGSLDSDFRTHVRADGVVFSLFVLPDDKILIDRGVTAYGQHAHGPARLNADGTLDTSFQAPADLDWAWSMAPAPDGRVLVGGYNHLVQLNPDGSLNPRFQTAITGGADNRVWSVAVQPDGQVLIEGDFTHVNSVPVPGFARLHGDLAPLPPTMREPLVSQTRFVGRTAAFTVSAAGTGFLAYQWLFNQEPIPGATSATLVLPELRSDQAGAYSVVVSNADGAIHSSPAILKVRPAPTGPGSVDVTFDLTADGTRVGLEATTGAVMALASQAGGKVLVAGEFVGLNGVPRNHIARIDLQGSVDPAFLAVGTDQPVLAVASQSDGKAVIGGRFTLVNGAPRPYLARLNPDGSLDSTFVPDLSRVDTDVVQAILVQPDGKMLAGGDFSEPVPRGVKIRLLRFHPDGSLDAGFRAPTVLNAVHDFRAFALQPDGRILVGYQAEPEFRPLERLKPDGSLDTTFASQIARLGTATPDVSAIAVLADGRILIGGEFMVTAADGSRAFSLVRLHPDGRLETGLLPELQFEAVSSLSVQPDGRVVVGGRFYDTRLGHLNLIRLDQAGRRDPTFHEYQPHSGADGMVRAVVALSEGGLAVGRDFDGGTSWDEGLVYLTDGDGERRYGVRSQGSGAAVDVIVPQADGTTLIGGRFDAVHGLRHPNLARLHPDGTLDSGFNHNLEFLDNEGIRAVAVQPDQRMLIGGGRFRGDGVWEWTRLARLCPDGRLDQTFRAVAFDDDVRVLALQPDGKVLVGGDFDAPNPSLVRLHADGTVDTEFRCTIEGEDRQVTALHLLSDGRILVGGEFWRCNSVARLGLAQLHPDGSLDASFEPPSNLEFNVSAFARSANARLIVGGLIADRHSGARVPLVRLQRDGRLDASFDVAWIGDGWVGSLGLQVDGRVIVSGTFAYGPEAFESQNLIRLNADGSWDRSFIADGAAGPLVLLPEGRLLAAAPRNFINGLPCGGVARLNLDVVVPQLAPGWFSDAGFFSVVLTGVAGGSYLVETSEDLKTWTALVVLVLPDGGLEFLDPNAAAFKQRFYRARGGE